MRITGSCHRPEIVVNLKSYIMERICVERLDGFDVVNSDQMSDVYGGRGGWLAKLAALIIRYGKEIVEGFIEGWNEGDCGASF